MKKLHRFPFIRLISLGIVIVMLLSVTSCTLPDAFVAEPEKPLVTEHTFTQSGTYTVRGGYISGSTTPSMSINLASVFDLQELANKNYTCNIEVSYYAKVQGDHLNVRCLFGGPTDVAADYIYLDNDEGAELSHASYNISGASYVQNATLYIKWECKGITIFDGLNVCEISDVRVTVKFS